MVALLELVGEHKSAVVADLVEVQKSAVTALGEGLFVSLAQPFQCLAAQVGYGLINGTPLFVLATDVLV